MGSNQVVFLHGFWGQSKDWNFLKEKGFTKSFIAPDYTQDTLLGPQNFLSDWGQNFLIWKKNNLGCQKLTAVGYSQGGRLLLQALAAGSDEFEKLIFISSHPGLTDFAEKEQRLSQDRMWAQKFRTAEWSLLQEEWDSQGVFQSKPSPSRDENDYDREKLAFCLENWSLAHQQDYRNLINQNLSKIHFVLGEQDAKFIKLYQDFLKDSRALKMEKGAAHRVPFDQPTALVKTLNSII